MNQKDSENTDLLITSDSVKQGRGNGKWFFLAGLVVGLFVTIFAMTVCYIAFDARRPVNDRQRQTSDLQITEQSVPIPEVTKQQPAVEEEKVTQQRDYLDEAIRQNQNTEFQLTEESAVDAEMIAKLQALEIVIKDNFYLHEVDTQELQDGVYKGIMNALDDPYTEYYTPEELQSLMEQTEGIYYGIGAYVSIDTATGLPKISGVIDHSPAQEAQLRPNDLISEVDGKSMLGMSLTDAVSLIKGPENTEVVLTLIREGENDYLTVPLIRRRVEAPTVEFSMVEDDIAYIQVTEFDDVTVDQFADALASVKKSDAKGIILDLRGNPGGSLSAVIEMCRMILPKGLVVYTEDKNGERAEYTCDGKHRLELPLVVLVDMNSASASEIMAGAIKDYGIGTLVGTTTFGKGIVQQIIPFKDGSAVKITISAYYTPNGNNIHGLGIEPDVVCEFDGEAYYGSEDHPDNQLEKAKEVLKSMYEE